MKRKEIIKTVSLIKCYVKILFIHYGINEYKSNT